MGAPEEAELDEPEALGVGDAVAAQDADVGTSTLLALQRLLAVLMMARDSSARGRTVRVGMIPHTVLLLRVASFEDTA